MLRSIKDSSKKKKRKDNDEYPDTQNNLLLNTR